VTGRAYGIPSVALRYFNVYGPRQALSNPLHGVCAIFSARLLNDHRPVILRTASKPATLYTLAISFRQICARWKPMGPIIRRSTSARARPPPCEKLRGCWPRTGQRSRAGNCFPVIAKVTFATVSPISRGRARCWDTNLGSGLTRGYRIVEMGQRTGSRGPGEQSHHRIGDATVGAVTANLNPDEEAPSEQIPRCIE